MGFDLLYKVIPLLSISSQLLPALHLEHFHIFENSINPSILGSSYWSFPKW
jgi:hemolysin-activating ACP:hemolysin acyltransferase